METDGNKWKQMETRIAKHIQTTNGKIAELSNSAYFTLHNVKYAQQITLCVKNMQGNVWTVSRSLSLPRWKAWEKRQF